ncbi:MAG: Hsp20/alpha crystallin family protein [Acidobacteriota bacterium]|nr:Hsp20/alpha crystallin family protein [Acidobacteriota bacterium]
MRRSGKFYGPMVELSRLQSELNRLFATFVETNQAGATATSWDPNVDVMDDGQKLRVLIEVPGIDPEDVRVMVRGRVLTVRGTKKGRTRTRGGLRFFCMERYFGGFVKSVALPRAVNTHQARTLLKDGLLEIVLPHVPDQREREYEIPVRADEERRE